MRYLALDLGSTYTKAALMADGTALRQISLPTPGPAHTEDGRYEIDAEAYWAQVKSLLEDLHRDGASALLMSTQMHGCVLTDDAFRPMTPYISWRDGLGAASLPVIRDRLGEETVLPSGLKLKGSLALCALLARVLRGEALPARARLCTLGGYMIGRMTGRHVCHMTNAAPTGLADVRGGCWNLPLLERAGLDLRLPRLVCDVQPVGQWRGMVVYPDLGDQQVCAAGATLTPERSLHVSVGTAGLIGALTARWESGPYENRPWLTPERYLRTISGLPGGRHMAGLAHLVGALARQFGASAEEDAVWAFLTACSPEEPPAADPWQRLTLPPRQWVAGLYADFAENYRIAAEQLALPIRQLAFSGGCAARNPALRQAVCYAFGCADPGRDNDAMCGLAAVAAALRE